MNDIITNPCDGLLSIDWSQWLRGQSCTLVNMFQFMYCFNFYIIIIVFLLQLSTNTHNFGKAMCGLVPSQSVFHGNDLGSNIHGQTLVKITTTKKNVITLGIMKHMKCAFKRCDFMDLIT